MSSVTRGALSSAEEGSPLLERPLARETPRGASRKVWIAALALVALVSCGVAAAATTTTWGRGRVGDISSSSAAAAPDLGRLGVNPDEGVNPVYSSIHTLDHKGRFSASSTKTKSAVDAALLAVNAHHPRAGEKKNGLKVDSTPPSKSKTFASEAKAATTLTPEEIATAVKDANDAIEASIAKNRTAAEYQAANVNREWSDTFYKMQKATNGTKNACVVASHPAAADADMACDASTAAMYEATTSAPKRAAMIDADVAENRTRHRAGIRAKRKHKRALNEIVKNDDGSVSNLGVPYVPPTNPDVVPRLGRFSLDGFTSLFEGASGAWGDATHVAGLVQDGGFSFFESDEGVNEGSGFCWKETYPRDAGTLPQHCEDHQEIIAGGVYCYDKCEDGWERFGYDCHKSCPSGWEDHGLLCNKPSSVYSRAHSPGCQWVSSTSYWPHWAGLECGGSVCSSQNKEDIAGQCYEYCPSGYDTIGFLCSANCQSLGFEGGVAPSCTQHVKLSPGMTKAQCAPGYEEDAGLCYKQCPEGFDGVGPVCWGGPPIVNGVQWVGCGMGAAVDDFTCASVTADQIISVGETILFFATLGSSSAATVPAKVGIDAGKKAISVAGDTAKAIKKVGETAKDVYDTSTDILGALDSMTSIETEADGIRAAAEVASLVDPTGLSSVVAAYAHDICTRFTGDSDEEMSFDEQSAIATENAKKEHYEENALESVKTCYWTDAKTVTATSQCAHDAYESAGGDAADAAELRDEMRELLRRSDDEGARFGALPKTTVTASGASFACDDASDFIVDEVEMFGKWIAGSGASYAKKKTTSASGGLVVALNATKEEEEGDESSSSSRRYVVSHHAGDRCKMVRFSISRASGTCTYAADEAGITIGGTHDCETAEGVAAAWDARQSRTLASTATAKGFGVGALKGYMPNVASK